MRMFQFPLLLYTGFSVVYAFYIQRGVIFDNTTHRAVSIQGISWFGFETEIMVLEGLDRHPIGFYLDVMTSHGINSIRVPFSEEWIFYQSDHVPAPIETISNPQFQSLKSIEILDELFRITNHQNITILLDLHRLNTRDIAPMWYSTSDGRYTTETFYRAWSIILDRYGSQQNLIGIDLLNEPHDTITYGDNNPSLDWFRFASESIAFFNSRYPNHPWLIFVQGVNWGRIFPKFHDKTLLLPGRNVVYSPHTYGKSVTLDINMDPMTLVAYWDQSFGYLKKEYGQCVVIGEWGGRTSMDTTWMSLFAKYLVQNKMTDNYFWSLTPNSDDVDGFLLADWTTIDPVKKILLHNIQSNIVPE